MSKTIIQAALVLAWACVCFSLTVPALYNQTTESSSSAISERSILSLCGFPLNLQYHTLPSDFKKFLKNSAHFNKRDEPEDHDPFADPVQILRTRLEFLEGATRCLFKASDTHPNLKNKEFPQIKNYFEQLLTERWSKELSESEEVSVLDALIASTFAMLQPVYEKPSLRQRMSELETMQSNQEISLYEKRIDDFRSVLVHHLYTKSMQYRDVNLHDLKSQLRDAVSEFYAKGFPETVQKCAVELLIGTTLELSDWSGHEYTPNQPYYYTKTQAALATRLMERLLAINTTLKTISVADDYDVFFRLVARAQAHASEFLNVNFPENKFTRNNKKLLRQIFAKIQQLELRSAGKAYCVSFNDLRVNHMRQKLNAVKHHLSDLNPVTGLPASAYWKLLQIKVDLRNWAMEISAWSGVVGPDEIKELHAICKENIVEVNRLKRTFDRHVPPETT